MSVDISTVLAKHSNGISVGPRFAAELSHQDRRVLDSWLASQRVAKQPDENVWLKILLGGKPFFRGLFENIICGRWSELIRNCAEPLDLLKERNLSQDFPILGDLGVHFLLVCIDHQRARVYAGEKPVLLDLHNNFDVWRIDTKDIDSLSVKKAELSDVPTVLLREWARARPKLEEARGRLCDIFSSCLAKS